MAIPSDQSHRVRPLFVAVIALVVITVIVLTIANRARPTEHWSVSAIRSEYQKIGVPSDSAALGDLDVLTKYGVNAVGRRYSTRNQAANLLRHYRSELTRNGWSYLGDFHSGEHWGESYCKRKLLARVELFTPQGPGEYAFSMSWGDVSEGQCP